VTVGVTVTVPVTVTATVPVPVGVTATVGVTVILQSPQKPGEDNHSLSLPPLLHRGGFCFGILARKMRCYDK